MSGLLEVRGVSRRFGGIPALSDVSLDAVTGEVTGLIGPNGAGKTTLFNVISGLCTADAGIVRIEGVDITHLPVHERAALGVGRSFQNLGLLLDETAEQNVLAFLHRATRYAGLDVFLHPRRVRAEEEALRAAARSALERFDLASEADVLVSDLSFGRARFVELAAVFAAHPRLVLLDEPTTGLDPREVSDLRRVLTELRSEGTTVLVVAHDVRFVMETCDYVYVLAEGSVLCSGPPQRVQSDPAVVEAYLGRAA